MSWAFLGILSLAGGAALGADLQTIAGETDPVKRARLALDAGEQASTGSGEACRAADYDKCTALLEEVQKSVELAQSSLQATGIDPARNPRHFKEAEIRTRKIVRLLEGLRSYIHPDDAPGFESVRRRVSDINDELLAAIMSKKKKRKK